MKYPQKHSITRRIGLYFLITVAFASLISSLSLGIMLSNRSDASMINIAGSLRMQSYRLLYEMENHPESVPTRLAEYQASLFSPELHLLEEYEIVMPSKVSQHYQRLKQRWQVMESYVQAGQKAQYIANLASYASEVNQFVSALQAFAELKLKVAIGVIAFSMLLIVLLSYFGVWYTRKRVIFPLNQLVTASRQVQKEDFNHIQLNVNEPNELGVLSSAFTQMARELAKLYTHLETEVENKTRRLIAVNRSLLVLYQCSKLLTTKTVDQALLEQVLRNVLDNEHLHALTLTVYGADYWNVSLEQPAKRPHRSTSQKWQSFEIAIENNPIARLSWLPSLTCPDERLIQSVSEMVGRSIYILRVQQQQQQLVLMEERAIIARELHDSLAQSLTFFKIQINLLKRTQESDKQQAILVDFEQALNEAYRQLRELLATFRLTIQEANLAQALEKVLDSLRPRSRAQIRLQCKLPSYLFNAQQQVHVLQIVREAVINAIKHAQASEIDVIAHTNDEGESCLIIRDNGIGIANQIEPEGHYGLTIMKERASQIQGDFSIHNRPEGGTEVRIVLPNMMIKQ